MASGESTAQGPPPELLERVNGILASTNDIAEDEVDRIAEELLEGYGHGTRHAKLRRCVAWSLYVRLDMPQIFLIPPLDNFSEHDSDLCGKGSFSTVYRSKYQGEDVAVKVLNQETLDENIDDLAKLLDEVMHWSELRNEPNITPFLGCFAKVNIRYLVYAIVSPLADDTLKKYNAKDHPPSITLKHILNVAKGLKAAHESGMVHGDVRRDNILLFDGHAKLTDFGISKIAGSESTLTLEDKLRRLILARAGPEVVRDGKSRTKKSDIFGYGSLVYELFAGKTAEFDLEMNPLIPLKRPEIMNSLWDGVWVIVSECWQEDPAKRPSADEIVSRLGRISLGKDELSEGIQLLKRLKMNLKRPPGQRSTN